MANRSCTLVQMVEDHMQEIAASAIRQIGRDPKLSLMASMPGEKIERQTNDILRALREWLVAADAEIAEWAEKLGGVRFAQSIPLNEIVRALVTVKSAVIDFIRQRDMRWTALELYTEEETEYRIGRFFDIAMCHVTAGYEAARIAAKDQSSQTERARPKTFAAILRG